MTFKLLKEESFPNKKIKISIFEHEKTKARHIHTTYDTQENSFSVSFRTLPTDSKGIPHILEHSVLCGSEKFPARNLFFNMRGRNFDTFMNASTGFETTQYPFSSIDKQGFFNLMEVYSDVVFFPKLEKDTFLQEGWRYEVKEENGQKTLQYSGVVFNEMIGAYSNPSRVSYVEMLKKVYSGSQYENFSGGNPLDITNLNYEEFLNFHKKYYHPSNATFYTFGSIPCEEIQNKLEQWVLSKFDYLEIDRSISMKSIEGKSFTGEHPGEKGVTYNLGWKLNKFSNVEDYYEIQLLCRLLSSGKNNISDKLIKLGSCGGFDILPINQPAILLSIDTENQNVENVKLAVNEFINDIFLHAIKSEEFDNIFDMIEMSQRKEGEEGFGRNINNRYVMLEKYDITDIHNIHNINVNKKIRERLSNPQYLKKKIEDLFINNESSFEYLSVANPKFSQNLKQSLDEKVYSESLSFTEKDLQSIVEMNNSLNFKRTQADNIEMLPKITLENIELPKERIKKFNTEIRDGIKIHTYQEETNDLVRVELLYPLNVESKEDLYLQNLVLNLMSDLAFKNMTIEESNFYRQSKTTDISGGIEIFEEKIYWKLGLLSLSENTTFILEKFKKVVSQIDFSDKEAIKSHITSYVRDFLNGYQESAHYYALFETRAKVNEVHNYEQLINLNYYTEYLSMIEKDSKKFEEVFEKLNTTYNNVFGKQPEIFFIGMSNDYKEILKDINILKSESKEFKFLPFETHFKNTFFDLNIPTNHVSVSYKVPQLQEKNGPAFKVLEGMIKDYLIKNIRQKNGAYGANADYSHNGILTFYSYRDSQIDKTIDLITGIPDSLEDIGLTQEMLEISKLNIVKLLKTPRSNMSQGILEFNRYMKGHYVPHDMLTDQVLAVTLEDIKNIIKTLKEPNIAVSSSLEQYKESQDWTLLSPLSAFKETNDKRPTIR